LPGTVGPATSTSDNEHTTASLGHSEKLSIKHPPGEAVPEFGQGADDGGHVFPVVRGEKAGDVLDDQPGGSDLSSDTHELVEKSGPAASQSFTVSGHGKVLAGKSSAENIDNWDTLLASGFGGVSKTASVLLAWIDPASPGLWSIHDRLLPRHDVSPLPPACQSKVVGVPMKLLHVGMAGDIGIMFGEDFAGVGVDLALPYHPVAGLLQAEVEAGDTREQRADVHGRCSFSWRSRSPACTQISLRRGVGRRR
jgi:hypothetical protein